MANNYYNFSPAFVPGTKVRSDQINTQYEAIESAFDLLPAEVDSLTRGIETYGTEAQGATANDFVVTMPNLRLTNQEGDEIQFRATHSNTGAATVNVDGIGAVPFVQFDGTPFVSGQIVSARAYEARYDNANTRFILSQSTDGAQQVLYAEEWAINAFNVPVSIAAGGDGVTTFSALHWATISGASATGMVFRGDHDASSGAPTPVGGNDVFRISVAGSFDGESYGIDDYTLYNGATFQKLGQFLFEDGLEVSIDQTVSFAAGASTIGHVTAGTLLIDNTVGDVSIDGTVEVRTLIAGTVEAFVDTNGLVVGASRTSGLHLDLATGSIQASSAATIADLSIQALGGNLNLGSQGANATTTIFTGSSVRRFIIEQSTGTVAIRSEANTDAETRELDFEHQNGTLRARIGQNSLDATSFEMRNLIHGGQIILSGEDAGGFARTIFTGDPDNEFTLYRAGLIRFLSSSQGVVLRSDGNTDTEDRRIVLAHQDGTSRAIIGSIGAVATLEIRNQIHGANVVISAENLGGTLRNMITADPDTQVDILHPPDAAVSARSISASAGGLQVNNTLTANGLERVATVSDLSLAAIQTGIVQVNNSTTAVILTGCEITANGLNGDIYVVEVYIQGTQNVAAADVRVQVDVTAGSVGGSSDYVHYDLIQYDATPGGTVSNEHNERQNNVTTAQANLTTSTSAADPFLIKGYGQFTLSATGSFTVGVYGAQQTAQVGNTDFDRAWIKLTKVN